jgi:hypothetical protein
LIGALLATVVLAGCGDGPTDRSPNRTGTPAVVVIGFDPDGNGPARPRTKSLRCVAADMRPACRRLRALPRSVVEPVPRDAVCTQVYGGPQTGRIHGVIEGRRVDVRLERTDGCEIARFDKAAPLLRLAAGSSLPRDGARGTRRR